MTNLQLEHEGLVTRLNKLKFFIESVTFPTLAIIDQDLLLTQLEIMKAYSSVLIMRLRRFEAMAPIAGGLDK